MGTRSDVRGFLKQERRKRHYSDSNEIGVRGGSESGKEESDEMVKYMSKLPAYLQGEESRNKDHVVLNVGVLDWSRLEKWKQQNNARDKCERRVSSTTTSGTTLPKASSQSHHQVHACSNLHTNKVKASRDLQHSSSLEPQLPRESLNKPLLGAHLSAKIKRMHSKTASRIFDQEKKRDHHSPPSKRFSFSFGRLSTSFTFKEEDSSSAATQPLTCFDTVNKSDSMRCDNSTSQSSNPEEEKHCASRVSPLRRLLLDHPLLKSKRSENLVLPSEARSTSSFNQDEKKQQDASRRTRALLQLTIRNGMPLFQFVVDDDDDNLKSRRRRRSILGATMKPSDSSSFKDDSFQYCTFYSVNEVVKKKRSWLIHGHKDKQQHRFVYNVIGEMRLSNVSSVMRESVLVDEKVVKEVAAVVIKKKKPAEETTTTVIVPGGVHSIPEKGGAPTPLISRWRSGGCCDCGGWDVGCKLHVLSSSKTSLLHDLEDQSSFKLFHQQEEEEESGKNSGPVLAMTELKTGIYRVEFGSFLSHLQAFFVCVTVITCASESEEETVSKTTGKSSSPFAPPLSPVGRA